MIQIKMFSHIHSSILNLENDVNKWLTEHQNIEIVDIKWHHDNTRVAMIVYKTV